MRFLSKVLQVRFIILLPIYYYSITITQKSLKYDLLSLQMVAEFFSIVTWILYYINFVYNGYKKMTSCHEILLYTKQNRTDIQNTSSLKCSMSYKIKENPSILLPKTRKILRKLLYWYANIRRYIEKIGKIL